MPDYGTKGCVRRPIAAALRRTEHSATNAPAAVGGRRFISSDLQYRTVRVLYAAWPEYEYSYGTSMSYGSSSLRTNTLV